jgi:hypothetical protein
MTYVSQYYHAFSHMLRSGGPSRAAATRPALAKSDSGTFALPTLRPVAVASAPAVVPY